MGETASRPERRSAPRHCVSLPVRFPGGTGVTRDVSSGGLYFFTTGPFEEGQPVWLKVTLRPPDDRGVAELTCRGTVSRVEVLQPGPGDADAVGVAVVAQGFGFDDEWSTTAET